MQEQLVIESHDKRDLNKMRSLRLPSEDPRIEGPPYMKGEKRPPEMASSGFQVEAKRNKGAQLER